LLLDLIYEVFLTNFERRRRRRRRRQYFSSHGFGPTNFQHQNWVKREIEVDRIPTLPKAWFGGAWSSAWICDI